MSHPVGFCWKCGITVWPSNDYDIQKHFVICGDCLA